MINLDLLCVGQKRKIVILFLCIVFAIFCSVITHMTIVVRNVHLIEQVNAKRDNFALKKNNLSKIETAISNIKKRKINEIFLRKNGYYDTFNKSDFISSIGSKINKDDDLEYLDFDVQKKTGDNKEYSNFSIKLTSLVETDIKNNLIRKIRKFNISKQQNIDINLDTNILHIEFTADYEFVAYKMLAILKSVLPGYIIVKDLSVKPVSDATKQFLYKKKFKPSTANIDNLNMDNRLRCSMEVIWVFLSSSNVEKFIGKGLKNGQDV